MEALRSKKEVLDRRIKRLQRMQDQVQGVILEKIKRAEFDKKETLQIIGKMKQTQEYSPKAVYKLLDYQKNISPIEEYFFEHQIESNLSKLSREVDNLEDLLKLIGDIDDSTTNAIRL